MIPIYKPYIDDEDIKLVVETIRSGWISIGPRVKEFEEKFSTYIGCKHAIAVSSCTAGLFLSLKALEIGENDEVIVPVYTFAATANVAEILGANVILTDVDRDYYNIKIEDVREILENNDKVKVVIPVHYSGQPVDMTKLMKVCKEYDVFVVEDAAHAVGACYDDGRKIGSRKDSIAVFSFYATKPMTTGDGGMICLDNDKLANKIKLLRLHGLTKDIWKRYTEGVSWKYDIVLPGHKFNMTDIQASLGISQLKKLDKMNKKRREIAKLYIRLLKRLEEEGLIRLPRIKWNTKPTCHIFPIEVDPRIRDKFIDELARKYGIQTSVHYIPLHRMSYYRKKYNLRPEMFPVAEEIWKREVSLPIYPQMTEEDVSYIVEAIESAIKSLVKNIL